MAVVAKRTTTESTKLLLIQRKFPPFQGKWALPGGFVEENEPLKKAAERELQEETSIHPRHVTLFEIGSYGDPGRDPRGWAISVLFAAVVENADIGVKADDDADDAKWFDIEKLPSLAFDHKILVRDVFNRLRLSVNENGVDVSDLDAALASDILQSPWTPAT